MLKSQIYSSRRKALRELMGNGIAFLPGNTEAPINYPANTYHFRQDSNFLYFFGLNQADLVGMIDLDKGIDILFGDEPSIDDIIWMGTQPSMKERASLVDVSDTRSLSQLSTYLSDAIRAGRKIHYVPPYRAETAHWISVLLGIKPMFLKSYASLELTKAIIQLREIKKEEEIEEIEKMIGVARLMHTTAMRMAKPGIIERQIFGRMEGIAFENANGTSFPTILSINGQTLHNHYYGNVLTEGRLIVSDAGCESEDGYCSDITRSTPVGGKFNSRQKEIYEIVLNANLKAIETAKPNIFYRDVHWEASRIIAAGLKELGLMKGDVDEAVATGAHALFFPHGLGHQMGLDVHDMEGLGEDLVGYDAEISRSIQFGLGLLRMAKRLKPGHIVTDEPGIYFIPALIQQWKAQNKFDEFIDYQKVETYLDFGGIRIEDDILITENGCRVLGPFIPKTVKEVEEEAAKSF
ncbi:MAG TPA: aminopeptidase P family protein [Bacteroidales bacterium]|jgi:Xaa-Pro aminopeptidase|nr:aminopeptidase P family protein [Bacteroidales bacterium]MDI9574521.1 aminopeptidase P family protein [Bacteroidota bacterium]OQC58599.1 MAG: Xaa-Pro aminopeptidase [Bacteroidetes bacterium ADurb.Bin012]MBP9512689.1 aminopeptidase P family protein [Bacteroidales bacterium]MBP9589295.1 aminopeptidase P family protein [Bacteroidales bacterium]